MCESDKVRPMVSDPWADHIMEITTYPAALCAGQEILLGDSNKPVAVVIESCLIQSREELMQYIANQNKPVEIKPDKADIRIEVRRDGVFIGFFSDDGKSAVLSLDRLLRAGVLGSESSIAISAWATDRIKQATRITG